MDEEDLRHLMNLYAERDRCARDYGYAANDPHHDLNHLDELKGALEEADDELANALCEWQRAD